MVPGPTRRLRFREMTPDDLADIAGLATGGRRGPAEWIHWNRDNYERHGFGLWVVETHGGEFIGDCGLTVQDVEGVDLVEGGWHVRSDRQRLGYAAEAAAAVRDHARDLGLEHLIAIIRPHNVASQGVARKIGMSLERTVVKNGGEARVYGVRLV